MPASQARALGYHKMLGMTYINPAHWEQKRWTTELIGQLVKSN